MDIFIKSFARPYYLERCIRSIHQYIKGNYSITVLDDGTSEVYLKKINELFPSIRILNSDFYDEKSKAIELHVRKKKKFINNTIPAKFWRETIKHSSEVFLLMEEDSWFIDQVNLEEAERIFNETNTVTLKLAWSGNKGVVKGTKKRISSSFEEIIPALPIQNDFLAYPFICNTLKIRSILTKLSLLGPKFRSPYYALYTVCSAFFRKEYWLYLWKKAPNQINESHQLIRALKWRQTNRYSMYGKSIDEKIKTSFIISSTNRNLKSSFDMLLLNFYFSELWMKNDLNAMCDMPHDFSVSFLSKLLDQAEDPDCTSEDWGEWIESFKRSHASAGCIVD